MDSNPDYESRKTSIKKLIDSLNDYKTKKDDIQKELSNLSTNIEKFTFKLKQGKENGLRGMPMESLQELAKIGEDVGDLLSK